MIFGHRMNDPTKLMSAMWLLPNAFSSDGALAAITSSANTKPTSKKKKRNQTSAIPTNFTSLKRV